MCFVLCLFIVWCIGVFVLFGSCVVVVWWVVCVVVVCVVCVSHCVSLCFVSIRFR